MANAHELGQSSSVLDHRGSALGSRFVDIGTRGRGTRNCGGTRSRAKWLVLVAVMALATASAQAGTIIGRASLAIDPDGPMDDAIGGLGLVGGALVHVEYTLDAAAPDEVPDSTEGRYGLDSYVLTFPSGDTYSQTGFGKVRVRDSISGTTDRLYVYTSGGVILGLQDGSEIVPLEHVDSTDMALEGDGLAQLLDLTLTQGQLTFRFDGTDGPGDPYFYVAFDADVVSWTHSLDGFGLAPANEIVLGAGSRPKEIIAADANADRIPDLLIANFGLTTATREVALLLGNGDGTFGAPTSLGASDPYSGVAVADLDFDQIPDVVAATPTGGAVVVQLGAGGGAFGPPVTIPTGNGPNSVAVADLDGDLIPDLVTSSAGDDNVSVLLGNGDGTFSAPVTFAAGDGATRVAVARLDGGPTLDLITANQGSDDVSVLLGNGDGSFQSAASYSVGSGPSWVATDDLDGDGDSDVVTGNVVSNDVSVLLNGGDGTFGPANSIPVGSGAWGVAIGDLDGDVVPDIVAANPNVDEVTALLGVGDGTFHPAGSFSTGDRPEGIALADLDGDGLLDVATGNVYGSSVSVLRNQTDPPVVFDWVDIGDPGNPPDPSLCCPFPVFDGSVTEPYRIGRYEVTNAQYTRFLNAVAADDPNGLWDLRMGSVFDAGGIVRVGSPGGYVYETAPGRGNLPVNHVDFWDAARFVNWIENGQPRGPQNATTTEDGAYTLTAQAIADNTVARNPGASHFLPDIDQWYKAAYYDATTSSYFAFPTASNTSPVCTLPGAMPNTANCAGVIPGGQGFGEPTAVGSYEQAMSPFGTFDQAGNVWEWTEWANGSDRVRLGGSLFDSPNASHSDVTLFDPPALSGFNVGFRVARTAVPEPGVFTQLAAGVALLVAMGRRRRAPLRVAGRSCSPDLASSARRGL